MHKQPQTIAKDTALRAGCRHAEVLRRGPHAAAEGKTVTQCSVRCELLAERLQVVEQALQLRAPVRDRALDRLEQLQGVSEEPAVQVV